MGGSRSGDVPRRSLSPLSTCPFFVAEAAFAGLKVLSVVDRKDCRMFALERVGRSGVRGSVWTACQGALPRPLHEERAGACRQERPPPGLGLHRPPALAQETPEAASAQWRAGADQIRPKC